MKNTILKDGLALWNQQITEQTTILAAASQGNYQLNVFMPVIIRDFLESCKLMTDAMLSFEKNCARGIKPNTEKIKENLDKSLMPVTALSPRGRPADAGA